MQRIEVVVLGGDVHDVVIRLRRRAHHAEAQQ